MSAELDKLSGKSKQFGGKMSDDKKMQAEGKIEELKGQAKDALGSMKDKLKNK